MLFGTIKTAYLSPATDFIAKKVAAAELAGKPTADFFTGFYFIVDLNECRWIAYRYYGDTVSFSEGDFVAFDTGNTGDVLRGSTNNGPGVPGIAVAPYALNIQAAYQIPEIVQRKIVGYQNVLRSSLTDEQVCKIEKVLAMISR